MGKYKEIRSPSVRERIKGRSWKDRGYIDSLVELERIVLQGGPRDGAEGFWLHLMQDEYATEYNDILRDLQHGHQGPPQASAPFDEEEARREWLELGGRE